MAMDNEQISTELAVMKSQITMLVQISQRVEALLEKIASFDKTQAELLQRFNNLQEKTIENAKKVEVCSSSHESDNGKLWTEVSALSAKANRAQGIAIGAMSLLFIIVIIAGFFSDYLFTTAQGNKDRITSHSERINNLEKELARSPYKLEPQ
jgi:t-SNARE complex subunit (syntaxin)